ncbi:MAG: hypothetical protein NUV97_00200 [archaeon]|nr:hypothetical protein [archaeon]MCR4323598.1 hypothetical protein [Nanoarchaeota archaeon]
MIVKIEVLYDDMSTSGRRTGDEVVRAVDAVMGGADWEAHGGGWIARR